MRGEEEDGCGGGEEESKHVRKMWEKERSGGNEEQT